MEELIEQAVQEDIDEDIEEDVEEEVKLTADDSQPLSLNRPVLWVLWVVGPIPRNEGGIGLAVGRGALLVLFGLVRTELEVAAVLDAVADLGDGARQRVRSAAAGAMARPSVEARIAAGIA